jgi:hypothetical protein
VALLDNTSNIVKTIDFIGDSRDSSKNLNVHKGPRKGGETSTETSTTQKIPFPLIPEENEDSLVASAPEPASSIQPFFRSLTKAPTRFGRSAGNERLLPRRGTSAEARSKSAPPTMPSL